MERGSISAKTCEVIKACTGDETLQKCGVEFGHIIHYTNPPQIDCSWPLEHDATVRTRLAQLRSSYRPYVPPKQSYTVTLKKTGHHELELDCAKSDCTVVSISPDYKETNGGWAAKIHECCTRSRSALYGFEVHAKAITRVELRSGGVSWARNLHATDHVQIDKPGNICWPLWLNFWWSTVLVIHSSSKPTDVRLFMFEVDEEKGYAYQNGIVTSYDFVCEDREIPGSIARFQSGQSGLLLSVSDRDAIDRWAVKMRSDAQIANNEMDRDATSSVTFGIIG